MIFSTHSVTLLKSIDHRRIIYLEKQDDAEVKAIVGCFPTYAIGNIASEEETLPDIMLYVEDMFARDILTAFFARFANEHFPDATVRPTTKIIPVGPFDAVVSFLERNHSVLPDYVVQKAILDDDVAKETIVNWKHKNDYVQLEKYKRLEADIKFLPFTPEVGLFDYISGNVSSFELSLRQRCGDNQIRIGPIVRDFETTLTGSKQRRAAKISTQQLINYLVQRTQRPQEIVREQLCGVFANATWSTYRSDFLQLLAPLVR